VRRGWRGPGNLATIDCTATIPRALRSYAKARKPGRVSKVSDGQMARPKRSAGTAEGLVDVRNEVDPIVRQPEPFSKV
jgi:hypothetical protein